MYYLNIFNFLTGKDEPYQEIFTNLRNSLTEELRTITEDKSKIKCFKDYIEISNDIKQKLQTKSTQITENNEFINDVNELKPLIDQAISDADLLIQFLKYQIHRINPQNNVSFSKFITESNKTKEIIENKHEVSFGYIQNEVFYLSASVKLKQLVGLIIHLNLHAKLNKVFAKEDLIPFIIKHFIFHNERLKYNTIHKYVFEIYSNVDNGQNIYLGNFRLVFFQNYVCEFLNTQISSDQSINLDN